MVNKLFKMLKFEFRDIYYLLLSNIDLHFILIMDLYNILNSKFFFFLNFLYSLIIN